MDNSWVKLYRKIAIHDVLFDDKALRVFIWLLTQVDKRTGKVTVSRYQTARELKLNPSTFRNVLKRLEKKYEIVTTHSDKVKTTVSLLKWAQYQSIPSNIKTCSLEKRTGVEDTTKGHYKRTLQKDTLTRIKNKELRINTLGLQKQTNVDNSEIGKVQNKPRKEVSYSKAILNDLVNYYAQRKGISPQGNEWLPIQQAVKTMLMNGRTPQEIKDFVFWLSTNWSMWDIHTVMKRLPEFVAGKLDAVKNKINLIVGDPIFKRYYEIYNLGEDWAVRVKMDLLPRLEAKYPFWRYEKEWQEARTQLRSREAKTGLDEDKRYSEMRRTLVEKISVN